jgi:hypothetical protein
MKYTRNMAGKEQIRNAYRMFLENAPGKEHLGDLGIVVRIIKWI